MAVRTFDNGAGTGDINNSANYTGAGALLTTDDLVFDATSTANATGSANLDVQSIVIAAAYTGNWSMSGFSIRCRGDNGAGLAFSSDGTGTLNVGTQIQTDGNNITLHIGAGIGAFTGSACTLSIQGAGSTLDIDKNFATFKGLTIGASAAATLSGAGTLVFSSATTMLTIGNNGSITFSQNTIWQATDTMSITSLGSNVTIGGNSPVRFDINSAAGIVVSIPGMTMTGLAPLLLQDAGGGNKVGTFQFTGAFSNTGGSRLQCYATNGTNTDITLDFNDQDITIKNLRVGVGAAGGIMTLRLGSGIVDMIDWDGTVYDSDTMTVHGESATVRASGNFTLGSNTVWTTGTEEILLDEAAACALTSSGATFYDVTLNKTANGVTLQDALSYSGVLTLTDGTWDSNGQTITGTTVGDLVVNTADAITFDAAIDVAGDVDINVVCTINRLIMDTGETLTLGANITLTNYVATDWDGIIIRSSVAGTQRVFTNPAGMNVLNVDVQDNSAVNPITCTGTDSGNNVNWNFPGGAALRRSQLGSRLGLGL